MLTPHDVTYLKNALLKGFYDWTKWCLLSPPLSCSCCVTACCLPHPCRSPHAPPKDWTECPHYSTDRPNECFFNENHTSIWTSYRVQLRSSDRAILYDENLFHVQEIGEFTACLSWDWLQKVDNKQIKKLCTVMCSLYAFPCYLTHKGLNNHQRAFWWKFTLNCTSTSFTESGFLMLFHIFQISCCSTSIRLSETNKQTEILLSIISDIWKSPNVQYIPWV